MKILHVHHTLAPRAGGVVSVVRQLAREQARLGHEVEIFTTNLDHPRGVLPVSTNAALTESGVAVRYFPTEYAPMAVSLRLWRALAREIRRFDIVHVHGLYRFPQLAAGFAARYHKVPYLMQVHGTLDPVVHRRSAKSLPLKRLYERTLGLPAIRRADTVYYTCETERRRGEELRLNDHGFVLPNGIDWKMFENLPARGTFRKRYRLGAEAIVLFVGRINFKKGLDLLIGAVAEIVKTRAEVKLVLVGPENDAFVLDVHGWIRDHGLENRVLFTGMLSEPEVVEACTDADVFVLPSYGENFGMSVVEAMACGCPVVVSDQVGIHEEVREAGAGLVVPCELPALTRAVTTILEDTEMANSAGRAGRRLARERFAITGVVRALSAEYETLIARRHRADQLP